jgi:EmrB/QacA subfamily drug resistance transporter
VTLAVLAIGAMSLSAMSSLIVPALGTIQEDLDASPTGATWVLTGYLLAASVATPIVGRLGDMLGKHRVLAGTMTVYSVATLAAALAPSIEVLIVARVAQGVGTGVFPLAFGVVRDEFPPAKMRVGIGLLSSVFSAGAAIGVVLGGPIVDQLGWHWLFWLALIPAALSVPAILLFVPPSPTRQPGLPSWRSAVLLAAWLVTLLLAISQGHSWGWASGRILLLFLATPGLIALWVRTEIRARQPLVDMRLMKTPVVWRTNTVALAFGFVTFGTMALVPRFVETPESTGYGFGYSATIAGLTLIPIMAFSLLISPFAPRLERRLGDRNTVLLGCSITSVGTMLLIALHESPWHVFFAIGVMGLGISFSFLALANLIVTNVPQEQVSVATGMNTNMRTIGGGFGAQITASLVVSQTLGSGLPAEKGYVLGFGGLLVAALLATLAAAFVPETRTSHQPHAVHPPPSAATAMLGPVEVVD